MKIRIAIVIVLYLLVVYIGRAEILTEPVTWVVQGIFGLCSTFILFASTRQKTVEGDK